MNSQQPFDMDSLLRVEERPITIHQNIPADTEHSDQQEIDDDKKTRLSKAEKKEKRRNDKKKIFDLKKLNKKLQKKQKVLEKSLAFENLPFPATQQSNEEDGLEPDNKQSQGCHHFTWKEKKFNETKFFFPFLPSF